MPCTYRRSVQPVRDVDGVRDMRYRHLWARLIACCSPTVWMVAAKRDLCRHWETSERALSTVRTGRRSPTTPSTVAGVTTTENGHGYRIEALGPQTWDAFADLAGRHNGVWGGCWCTYFHRGVDDSERTQVGNQAYKQRLVEQGRAHAALVFDGDVAVAWCQFGTVEELPNIHHRKEWEQGLVRRPDFRITCLFVDRRYRRKGVAATAVLGALELIGIAGGGLVEAYPHDLPPGKKTSASFLYNATRTMYEQLGFTYQRPKGQGNCVMTKEIPASSDGGVRRRRSPISRRQ